MYKYHVLRGAAWLEVLLVAFGIRQAAAEESPEPRAAAVAWMGDYREALDAARCERKSVLLWFYDPAQTCANASFEADVLSLPSIASSITRSFVAAKLPLDAALPLEGESVTLLDHAAYADLGGGPGLAIIDLTDVNSPNHGSVVSVYPLSRRTISAEHLAVLLDLPPGSLTQRTLIFAVRTHADRPASGTGPMHPLLAAEAEAHSHHQASLDLQGHHNWDSRFQRIIARLPRGHVAYEVCAESWPGQTLVEAAEECVDSWRQSSGHWNQVTTQAECYGYDMRRGAGGVWYATGIFGRRRD